MKLYNTWGPLSRIICLSAVMVSTEGCIYDNLDGCGMNYSLIVRAYEMDSTTYNLDVEDVKLFIFDSTRCFIQSIDTRIGLPVTLNVPPSQKLHIVAWGNLAGGKQACTAPLWGESIDNCFVNLFPDSQMSSCVISPDDLFRGEISAHNLIGVKEIKIPIFRETGSMTITVRNLRQNTRNNDNDDYWAEVRDTYSTIRFDGSISGNRVSYRPSGSFILNGDSEDYNVPPFTLLPDKELTIDIYHGTERIATVSNDNSNRTLVVEKGLLTNVLIDLSGSISVSISLSEWGVVERWKVF